MTRRLVVMRTCRVCEGSYEDRGSHSGIRRDVCSTECQRLRRIRRAQGQRAATRTCEQCGATFLGDRRRRFCSRRCSADHQKAAKLRGETIPCAYCGAPFYRKRSAPNQRFCSHRCRGAALPPPSSSPQARAKIARAKLGCGETGLLHMHHVIPRSMHRAGISEIRNGIPLCPRCHNGWHRRTITIHRDIFTSEEWTYLTSVELVGQDVRAWLDDRYPGERQVAAA